VVEALNCCAPSEILRTTFDTTPRLTVDVEAVPDKRAKTIERLQAGSYLETLLVAPRTPSLTQPWFNPP